MNPNDSSDAAAQDKDSTGFFSQNERSWPDDARDEDNGSYQNVCCSCRKLFIGHKDRVMCKACFLANPDVAAALATERAKSEQAFALVDEYESELHAKDKENTQLQATVARLEGELAEAKEGRKQIVDKWTLAEQEIKEERDQLRDQLAAEKAAHENTKQKCALYRQHSEAQDKLLSQFQDGGAEAIENAREDEIEKLRADLEAAKRERDEAREQADTVRGALIQQCLRAGMTVCTTEDATNLVEMLGTTLAEAQRREFERDEHDEQKQELGLRLLADRDSLCAQVEQLTTDRDALAFQVERLREALEKVASLINESTGVAGLHLNGEVAPWCDLMTGGKYEGWLCGVFESLQLDAPTALRERLEAETKPLVEALEKCVED